MTPDPCEVLLERLARANEPAPGAVERVVERVLAGERDPVAGALLDALPLPSEDGVDRLVARAIRPARAPTARPSRLALAAAVLVGLVAVFAGVRVLGSRAAALDARLESEIARTYDGIPRVDVTYVGRGEVAGTRRNPVIFWEVGRLTMCLTPKRGIHLVVETPDGRAEVHGTCFVVERSALGTRVTVTEGRVEVTCAGSAPGMLDPGGSRDCRPTRPAALLARARALEDRGDNDGALSTLDDALARSTAGDPARGEILALQFDIRVARDDLPAALQAARAYLAEGYEPRRADMADAVPRLEGKVGESREGKP